MQELLKICLSFPSTTWLEKTRKIYKFKKTPFSIHLEQIPNQNIIKNYSHPLKPIPMVTSSLKKILQNLSKIKTYLMSNENRVTRKTFSLVMVTTCRWWALYDGVRNLHYLQFKYYFFSKVFIPIQYEIKHQTQWGMVWMM